MRYSTGAGRRSRPIGDFENEGRLRASGTDASYEQNRAKQVMSARTLEFAHAQRHRNKSVEQKKCGEGKKNSKENYKGLRSAIGGVCGLAAVTAHRDGIHIRRNETKKSRLILHGTGVAGSSSRD
jgi:hypothetical protein